MEISSVCPRYPYPCMPSDNNKVAAVSGPPDYPEPPKRPNVPTTFEVHVDCKITNKNMSTEIHEYYDYNNNRGLLHQVQDGEPFYLYYDYNTNEMLSIFPNERMNFPFFKLYYLFSSDLDLFFFIVAGSGSGSSTCSVVDL